MRTGVPHRVLLPHHHFAAEQLPYEIKLSGKMIVVVVGPEGSGASSIFAIFFFSIM